MKRNKKILFCNCPCAFNRLLFRNIMIFYLNLFKAIKFALKVIDINSAQARTVPRNKIKDLSTHRLQCSLLILLQLRLIANCRYNFLRHISFTSPNCKLGAGLFISITLRANLIAVNKLNRKSLYSWIEGYKKHKDSYKTANFSSRFIYTLARTITLICRNYKDKEAKTTAHHVWYRFISCNIIFLIYR